MAEYIISGVWKNTSKVITHYAFHEVGKDTISRAKKLTKKQAIELLETKGNFAKTWIWNYSTAFWSAGEDVIVVNGQSGKFLRSTPDNTTRDNLANLIDFDWIFS